MSDSERKLKKISSEDHLHSSDHPQLLALLSGLVGETERRLTFNGTEISTEALAALRITGDTLVKTDTGEWPGVSGLPVDSDHQEAVLQGRLPESLETLTADGRLASVTFRPRPGDVQPDRGMRSLRLDRAVEVLLGDAFK